MAPTAEGIITVSYRPLATMDKLHILLLAAVSVQTVDVTLLGQVFSLPSNVITKELAVLQTYGLALKVGENWTATERGQRLVTVWNTFQQRDEADMRASGRKWLLGPGEFSVDEMIRDKDEIEALARGFGVADSSSAVKYLDERRRAAERLETFIREWPPREPGTSKHGVFTEALVFDHVKLAETDEALTRLEELLASHIGAVVDRHMEVKNAEVQANRNRKTQVAVASLRKDGEEIMKKFERERKTQRWQNQHLARVKMICEVQLAGQWLSTGIGSLMDAFDTEPAAFVFRSTVPFVQKKVPKKPPAPRVSSPPPTAKPQQEEEGVLRSLFRWLFG